MKNHRPVCLLWMVSAWVLMAAAPAAAQTTIKVAIVTPEGSAWTETMHRFAKEVADRTGGAVTFQILAGGVSGDEVDVIRKMRARQIHAAGFSGVGLGFLVPEIRVLEAPLLFKGATELDHVKDALFDRFAAGLEDKGYVLLGFAEAGFVYFFGKQDLSAPGALTAAKMWSWKGDPVAETFLTTFGMRTVPLHVADVNTGLETGMIDAFYAPPLAAVAFQWYARVRYLLDYPMVNSTGALIMSKPVFDHLEPAHQALLRDLSRHYCRDLVDLSRRDNAQALVLMREAGINFVRPDANQVQALEANARRTYDENIPSLYSRELFDQVEQLLADFRRRS